MPDRIHVKARPKHRQNIGNRWVDESGYWLGGREAAEKQKAIVNNSILVRRLRQRGQLIVVTEVVTEVDEVKEVEDKDGI